MKKVLLTLSFAIGTMASNAQYFSHLYGTTNDESLTDGHNVSVSGSNGGLMVAPSATATNEFTATRTDGSGNIPASAPYFNNGYEVSDMPGSVPGLIVNEVHSVELAGTGYAVAGSYSNGGNGNGMGVFYRLLQPDGTVAGAGGGYFPAGGPTYTEIRVQKIAVSLQNPNNVYICGYLRPQGSATRRIFILCVDGTNGALQWSRVCMDVAGMPFNVRVTPYDIVELPAFNSTHNTYEVAVVGAVTVMNGAGNEDGFVLRVDYANGITLSTRYYGNTQSQEHFTCIKPTANPVVDGNGAGFVLGGVANTANANDFWFAAVDQAGSVLWSSVFNYNMAGATNNDYCNDITVHEDVAGSLYEYYLAGYTDDGVFSGNDIMVIKADQNGNAVTNGQFTYGTSNSEIAIGIDWTATSPGISIYGTAFNTVLPGGTTGGLDHYFVKARGNGTGTCDYAVEDAMQNAMPVSTSGLNDDNVETFGSYETYVSATGNMNDNEVCICNSPNMVAHWNFTNGSLVDNVNSLTGTIVGGVTAAAGRNGVPNTAYSFDGTSGYIQVPYSSLLDLTSWTIAAVVRPDGFYTGDCQTNAIVYRGVQYGNEHSALLFFDQASDHDCYTHTPSQEVFATFAAGTVFANWPGTTMCVSNPCISTGTWYCVWGSYDAVAEEASIWVDGVLRVREPWPNTYTTSWSSGNDLFIGTSNIPSFEYFFNGVIDDIAIYDGAIECPLDCDVAAGGAYKSAAAVPALQSRLPQDITVYPNPANDRVTIITPIEWKNGTISVINAVGQEVANITIGKYNSNTIDISTFPAGVYILKVENAGEQYVSRFVKN